MREPIERWVAKPFMKFYPSDPVDWWKGCVAGPDDRPRTSRRLSYLTLDEEGLYHRICNWMYLTGYDLPGDNMEAAKELHVNHNQYAVVLERLIYKGALIRYQGTVISNRVLKERIAFIDKKQPKTSAKAMAARERETKARIVRESPIGDTLRDLRKGLGAPEFADIIAQIEVVLSEYKSRENDPPSQAASPPQSTSMTPPVKTVDPPSQFVLTPPVIEQRPPQSRESVANKIKALAEAAEHKTVPSRAQEIDRDIEKERDTKKSNRPKKTSETNKILAARPYTPDFQEFWAGYPDTETFMSKKDAWVAWQRLTIEQQQQATSVLPMWRSVVADRKRRSSDYVCLHAQGFLNQRRFEALAEIKAKSQQHRYWWQDKQKLASMTPEKWEALVREHANGIWPVEHLGFPPASGNRVIPDPVIEKMNLKRFYDITGDPIPGMSPPWMKGSH